MRGEAAREMGARRLPASTCSTARGRGRLLRAPFRMARAMCKPCNSAPPSIWRVLCANRANFARLYRPGGFLHMRRRSRAGPCARRPCHGPRRPNARLTAGRRSFGGVCTARRAAGCAAAGPGGGGAAGLRERRGAGGHDRRRLPGAPPRQHPSRSLPSSTCEQGSESDHGRRLQRAPPPHTHNCAL